MVFFIIYFYGAAYEFIIGYHIYVYFGVLFSFFLFFFRAGSDFYQAGFLGFLLFLLYVGLF